MLSRVDLCRVVCTHPSAVFQFCSQLDLRNFQHVHFLFSFQFLTKCAVNWLWRHWRVWVASANLLRLDWIEQGLTSPPTQYRLSCRQFYRSKDPTNSIKVLKEKLASHRPEEAPNPPGAFHRVTSEPLKKEKPYHSGSSPARQSPTQQAGLYKSCIEPYIVQQ